MKGSGMQVSHRNSRKRSALNAIMMLAAVNSMFIIDVAGIRGTLKFIILCLVGVAFVYFLIKFLKSII
jgi:hypothetical protein